MAALRVSSHKLLASTVTKSSSCLKPRGNILSYSISPYLRRCRTWHHLASLSTLRTPATTHQHTNPRNFHSTAANMSNSEVGTIKTKDEFQAAIASDKLVVIDFYATWCGPCKLIAPRVQAFASDYAGQVAFYKVDVDEVSDVASDVGVRAMPTFLLFKNGEKVAEVVGANPAALKAAIDKNK